MKYNYCKRHALSTYEQKCPLCRRIKSNWVLGFLIVIPAAVWYWL